MKKNISETIAELLTHMGVSSPVVSMEKDDFGTVYMVETPDSRMVIGNRGETLLALNHIVKRITGKKEGMPAAQAEANEENFSIDVQCYQKEKNVELRARAHLYATRAMRFQSDVEMDPMSSYERMVVHAALAGSPGIKTESSGYGRERRVVVRYIQGAETP